MTSESGRDTGPSPIKASWFHVLLALADGAQHGFAVRRIVAERTGGAVTLYPATLYGSIRDLSSRGLIEPLEGADDPDDDQRRRYYRLTPAGRDALRAEVERLQGILDQARGTRALRGS